MKAKEIESLESYFKTDNEHWNEFLFELLCEVIKQDKFKNLETPLELFSKSIQVFTEHSEHPLKAVQQFANEIEILKLTPSQSLFVYESVCKYLSKSAFDFDQKPIEGLLSIQIEKLKAEAKPIKPVKNNIRETLKGMMQKEIEKLPETLKELEPVQRLNILCRMMPFILPKVESIHHEYGEPLEDTLKW